MPRPGDIVACRDCGTVALQPYPRPVSRGDWVWVSADPDYQLCPGCHLARTRRILGGRSA